MSWMRVMFGPPDERQRCSRCPTWKLFEVLPEHPDVWTCVGHDWVQCQGCLDRERERDEADRWYAAEVERMRERAPA